MKHHRYSFFGQKTGILFDSAQDSQPFVYFRFLKILPNGNWEKPSLGEGKNIKFNLLELLELLSVLQQPDRKWSTVHKFQNDVTSITIESKNGTTQFIVSSYSKQIKYPERKLMFDLLKHVYEEELINATGVDINKSSGQLSKSTSQNASNRVYQQGSDKSLKQTANHTIFHTPNQAIPSALNSSHPPIFDEKPNQILPKMKSPIDPKAWLNKLNKQEDFCLVPGEVLSIRDKAIEFKVSYLQDVWIPKSCVKESNISLESAAIYVKEWFLQKKIRSDFW